MKRNLLAGLAPLLAITAFAVVPAAAQAAPHWYKQNVLLGSTPVAVRTAAALTFAMPSLESTATCKVKDEEEIWNPAGGGAGEDLLTSFLPKCKTVYTSTLCPVGSKITLSALGLPWSTTLLAGTPVRDEIRGVRIRVACLEKKGIAFRDFSGTLTPEVLGSTLVFGGAGGGSLSSGANPMTVSGPDKLSAPPGKVTAF